MSRGRTRTKGLRTGETGDLFGPDLDPLAFERIARGSGYCRIAGLDEAGRGPLAEPVVAAAVILPEDLLIPGVTDSKQVPEAERERLYEVIVKDAVAYGVGIADERTIEEVNILQATIIAMERALACIAPPPDYLLLDAITLPRVAIPQKPLVKGDIRSHSIAAASILAKVTRDRLMQKLHEEYPQYNFQRHKGYGTKEHCELIRRYGPCKAHRRTFAPIAGIIKDGDGGK